YINAVFLSCVYLYVNSKGCPRPGGYKLGFTSLLSFSQPISPYTLLTNTEDYHNMPKPRHCRPSRPLRLLGLSLDLFWMSIDQPPETSVSHTLSKSRVNLSPSPGANHSHRLEKEAAGIDFGPLPPDVARSIQSWLAHPAMCELFYKCKDLGPAFWPRWLHCSFPSVMECMRAQTAQKDSGLALPRNQRWRQWIQKD
uniref:Uncharacterized protein n=1 Tax=Scophthalmus maximus TaxID=52904 RepID=A0A8D3B1Z3_SCOMX